MQLKSEILTIKEIVKHLIQRGLNKDLCRFVAAYGDFIVVQNVPHIEGNDTF